MKSLHKRILALLLSMLMVISLGIMPVAADQTAEAPAAEGEVVDAPVASESAKALVAKWSAFGIIPAETDPLATATRGGVAKMLADLLGVSGVSAASEITDVPAEIAGAARAARDLGFFEVADGKFRPDDSVSLSDVLKAMAVLVGYPADLVAGNGGSLALQSRLCKGIDGNHAAACNWETILKLMDNVSEEEIIRVIGMYNGKAFSAEVAEGTTILNEYLKLYEVEGMITATPTTAIDGGQTVKNGVRIGGEKYIDKVGLANKVGYAISGWYKAGKNDKTIVYAEPQFKDQQTWVLGDRDILASSTVETIYYVDEETYETEDIDISDAIFVYNGAYLATPEDADVKPLTGQLEIVDNDGDKDADVVYITSAVAYVVADVNGPARYISDRYDETKAIKIKESCELTVLKRGEVISMDDIKKNNVVYLGMSKDGKTAVMDVYAVQQRGTLTGFDDEYMYIDGNPYLIGKDNYDEMIALELGGKFTFFLGMDEAVIGAAAQVSNDTYGYLTNVGYVEEGLDEYGLFRIFDATYGFMNYRSAEKVFVNGVPKTPYLATEAVKDAAGAVVAQAVMFRTNADGELTHLQLATETPSSQLYNEAVFSKDVVLANAQVKLPGLIDSKVMFSGDMTTIQVPKDAAGNIIEDAIAVVPFSKLNLDYANYSGICYDVTADRNVKLFIWERVGAASATLETEDPFIVSRVYKKLNKDGRPATFVDGMRAGATFSVELYAEDFGGIDPATIKPGDVLWVSIDTMNRMVAAKHAFSLADRGVAPLYKEQFGYVAYDSNVDNPPVLSAVGDTNIMGVHNSLAHCKPTRVMGSNLLIQFSENVPASLIGPTGGPICYVFDEETKTLRTGNLAADVRPYDDNQTLLIWMYSGRYTRTIVVNHKAPKEYSSWLYEPFTTAEIGSDGMPGHSGGSETWISDAPLNYEIVNEGGARGNVLRITQSGASNEALQVVTTETTAAKLKDSYSYTLKFRVKVDSISGGNDVSIKLGGAGVSGISITGAGNLCLENGWGRQELMALTMGDWYEIVMQVSKSSATATATSVFVNGERKITHTANDGNWAFNDDKGYFNIQAQDFGGMIPMDYDISIDDITITYPNMPDEINADGETPVFSDLIIPNYLERDEFKDAVISGGSPSNGDGANVMWIGAGEVFSVSNDPSEAGDKILNVSNSGITAHWAAGWKLSSTDLTSGVSVSEYTLEFKMSVASNTSAHAWGPRPIFLMFGNGWLAFNTVGGRTHFGFSGENADWGTAINEGPAASKGIPYEAIGSLAPNMWYTVTIHVHDAGLVDISITDGTDTISIANASVGAGSTPTPQKGGYYLGANHGINSGATNPWTISFDYIAMDIED